MASHNLVRKLVSASSCLPFRRTQLLKSSTGNSLTAVRNEVKGRYMSSASQQLSHDDKESQMDRRDDGALYRDRSSPFRVSDLMDSFFPTRNMRSMMETMDRIFDDSFFAHTFRESPIRRSLRTPWDFKETDDAFKLRLDMPGLSKEEVTIYVEDDCLVIKGEHSTESKSEEDQWTSRSHGRYSTRILLPDNANPEQIKAELKNGVLNVTVPKVEKDLKKNVIDVHVE